MRYRIMAITSAFQADDAGSIPAPAPAFETSLIVSRHWRIFYSWEQVVLEKHSVLWL